MDIDTDQYVNITFDIRKKCAICESKLDNAVIELPDFPLTEIYTNHKIKKRVGFVDQKFHFCSKCGHGQIAHIINQELLYGKDYFFRTSTSPTGRKATDCFLAFINTYVKDKKFDTIIEIGCNDLYMLKEVESKADHLVGIDPVLKGKDKELSDSKLKIYGDFLENVIEKENLSFNNDLVICNHTLEHICEPKSFVKYLLDNASHDTLFAFQFPCLEPLLEEYRFDQIFHQHLHYFSFKSILYMLNELGAVLVDYKINYEHWGAIMILFKKKPAEKLYNSIEFPVWEFDAEEISKRYVLFKENMKIVNESLKSFNNKKIFGYGAALMLPVLSYHLKNDLSCLECIIDDDLNKDGLSYINLPVTIKHSESIDTFDNSVIFLTAISAKDNVRKIICKLINKNVEKIIVPLTII